MTGTRTSTATRTAKSSKVDNNVSVSSGPLRDDLKGYKVKAAPLPNLKSYTWEEIAQHNTVNDAWIYVGQKVYDVTEFIPRHPGGSHIMSLCAGRDCTDLIESYHPFSSKPHEILPKYCIGQITTTEYPQYDPDTGFYAEIREKCKEYFVKNNIDPKSPWTGLRNLAIFMTIAFTSFFIIAASNASTTIKCIAAILFGSCQALCLLHCMHDASHTSIGSSPTWWSVIGRFCMDWFSGASLTSWHNQHVLGHHIYTNVMHADPDLPVLKSGDVRRITPYQGWLSFYRWQHVYLTILYGSLAIKFRIQDITDTVMAHTNGPIRVNGPYDAETRHQIITKGFWFVWRILVPLFYFQQSILSFIGYFLLAEMITGYFLTINFQVSHVTTPMDWPDITKGIQSEWAVSQLRTSLDYGHGSFITAFLSGALNYQTVHHLFPSISQYHYPALAPIIQSVCKKWKLPYNHVDGFGTAFYMHLQHLKTMGNDVHVHY